MMIVALLSVILVCLFALILNGHGRVPWANSMRRVRAGQPGRAEWIAPDEVIGRVEVDYMEAVNWLRDSAFNPPNTTLAARYLAGHMLEAYRNGACAEGARQFIGVLRASHQLDVRRFDENGEQCVVVDAQQDRRMASYCVATGRRVGTQAMGEATLVYKMAYDRQGSRWKLQRLVQQLPPGWHKDKRWMRVQSDPLARVGRDS